MANYPRQIHPLPNQKSKINKHKSSIHVHSAAGRTNRVALDRTKIRPDGD
jgi:hypothetical protein